MKKIFIFLVTSQMLVQNSFSQDTLITTKDIGPAEKLIDMNFSPAQKDSMLDGLKSFRENYVTFHQMDLSNDQPYPLAFDPILPGMKISKHQDPVKWVIPTGIKLPKNKNDLAYYSILQLASLIKNKQITSVELTRFFISRLKKYGGTLHCVISLTSDIAMKEARKADKELARGIYKGPLQGIPYGAKDLFAVPGTLTTWGTPPYRNQVINQTAFVIGQLEKAGAVLVAKLSLGELAMDDVWFGGQTRNPWDTTEGSSGSSAGPASATAAGLVPFAIGTETWGSIVAPSATCGVTGLRPTYGSISRSGAMTLAWSSDKIGPICHSAEDAAIVFSAIHGTDGLDNSAGNFPFNYSGKVNWKTLKIAYARNYIDSLPQNSPEKNTLNILKKLGAHLIPITFPDHLHYNAILGIIVGAESAAAFDVLTRSHMDSQMVQQKKYSWPNQFRTARFIPAVEYINACRHRYEIMQKLDPIIEKYDMIVVPTFAGEQLAATNLTGHPVVVLPTGLDSTGHPTSITFIGKLYQEGTLLSIAKSFQAATVFNKEHPPYFLH
ncbi:MAG: amidase [Chitinophagaceae bacterium]